MMEDKSEVNDVPTWRKEATIVCVIRFALVKAFNSKPEFLWTTSKTENDQVKREKLIIIWIKEANRTYFEKVTSFIQEVKWERNLERLGNSPFSKQTNDHLKHMNAAKHRFKSGLTFKCSNKFNAIENLKVLVFGTR